MTHIPTPAPECRLCSGCHAAATQAAITGVATACPECGSVLTPEPAGEAPSALSTEHVPLTHDEIERLLRRGRPGAEELDRKLRRGQGGGYGSDRPRQPPSDPDKRLRAVVAELLAWDFARNGCGAHAQRSSLAGVLETLRSGIVGDGNRGTKGTWRGGAVLPSMRTMPVSHETSVRVASLSPELRAVVHAICEDAGGVSVREVPLWADKTKLLTLEQRIGWRLADQEQLGKWLDKIKARDSAPALEGMRVRGEKALEALVTAWFALEARAA